MAANDSTPTHQTDRDIIVKLLALELFEALDRPGKEMFLEEVIKVRHQKD